MRALGIGTRSTVRPENGTSINKTGINVTKNRDEPRSLNTTNKRTGGTGSGRIQVTNPQRDYGICLSLVLRGFGFAHRSWSRGPLASELRRSFSAGLGECGENFLLGVFVLVVVHFKKYQIWVECGA
jgi:hypothetical protein